MRKLFLLLPALVLSLITNAAVISINTETADALRKALNSATDGDIIEMAAGTYVESNENFISFTGKHVTVRAAGSAEVIIQPQVPITVSAGGCAHFQNVKIDASRLLELADWYEHIIYATDATANNRIILEGCEIYGFALNKSLISCSSSNTLDALTINNCYFHNINKSCVFIENTSNSIAISITNSTFANITTDAGSYYAGVIDTRATSGSFLVDHCTFYNVEAMNTDYAAIGKMSLSAGAVVSNCIFALSVPGASSNRTIRDIVAATNCLVYNYTTDSGYGMQSNVTKTGCFIANPLFADAANGDFSLAGDWTTMSLSPARGAATDGSDLGDPRWAVAETLPSTDFASSYILLGEKAILSGNFALNGDNFIQSQGHAETGVAVWKIHAVRKGMIQATLNIDANNGSGHRFEIEITNAENAVVANIAETADSWSKGDQILGSIEIPEAGDYKIVLKNYTNYSSTILEGITLTYLGGAVIPVSPSANTTLNIADALFSGCTRDADYIQFPSSGTSSAWIKWNISTSETAFYDITLNIDAPNAHGLTVAIYENEAEPAVASVTEGSYVSSTGVLALALGRINLVGGKNYIVKVTNAPSGSTAKITSLIFAPVVSSTINLPDVLPFNQAVLSTNAHVTDSKLYFAPIGDTNPEGEWAQWAVATDHDGLFLFTMNVNSDNGQSYRISILDDGENLIDSYEHKPSSGAQTITHYFALPVGNYSVKVENTTAWSRGYLTSLVVTEPSVVTIDETATDNSTWASKVEDSNTYDVQIFRSLRAGMYNTFCLPFAVASDMCKDVFGNDVEIYTLDEAIVDGEVLNVTLKNSEIYTLDEAIVDGEVLNVTLKNSDGIYQGTPVFIKPSTDIVNPIFTGVEFKSTTPAATTKTNANFVGTFVSTTLTANSDILYLGPDNTLYYPETDTPIKGFRAWFTIHGAAAPVIRRMNIIERTGEATSINLINETKDNGKRIENGQLIIIRDGIRYNAMGMMIK